MFPANSRRRARFAALACLISIVACAAALPTAYAADPMDEYQVKAAFLLNFAKFVVWPPRTGKVPADRFLICILGDDPFHGALEQETGGKKLDGRELEVRQVSDAGAAGNCHILFVSASGRKRFRASVERVRNSGVLTIGDSPGFAAEGAVIDFKFEGGKIRFEVNLEAADLEQLRISSKLLSLAEIVKKTR